MNIFISLPMHTRHQHRCPRIPLRCEELDELDGEAPGCRDGPRSPTARKACIPRMIGENRSLKTYSLMHRKHDERGLPRNLPERWRARGHFFFVSHLLAHMLRPNPGLRRDIAAVKDSMKWNQRLVRPLLSLHVRRGDACNAEQIESKARRCDDLAVYMKAVKSLAERYGYRSIYLATDDAGVVADTKNYPEFTWLYAPNLDRSELKTRKW